nr:propanediol dehydratase [Synergistaceae bacterium]
MQFNEDLLRKVIEEVMAEVAAPAASAAAPKTIVTEGTVSKIKWTPLGTAKRGTDPREVVVALPPAFGDQFQKTI